MSIRDFASSVLSPKGHVLRVFARPRWSSVWWGLLGALAVSACGSEGETSGDESNTPDMGDAGAGGEPGSGGDSGAGGSSTVEGCEAGEFDDDDASACVKWSDCVAGEYVKKAGTPKSDRQCAACGAGTFSTSKNASACAAWTECAPGQYVSAAGSDTEDQQCAGCSSGTFSASVDASSCTAWSDCEAGTYASNTPSATADRVCMPCAEGTHTTGSNESVCQLGDACAAGTVQTAPGTSTTAPVCAACDAGSYCAGGAAPAEDCPAGTWDHDANPATECAAKTDCAAGEHVSAEGDTTHDRSCTGCASGSYSTTLNALSCTTWATCAAGTHVSNTPSAIENRACEACADGTYTTGENESVCHAQNACPAGTVQAAPGTGTSAPECDECDAGSYCAGGTEPAVSCGAASWDHDENPATACADKTDCVAGEYEAADGSATTDRTCDECADGSYSTMANAPSCTEWSTCAPGEYVSLAGSVSADRQCSDCENATFSATTNALECAAWTVCSNGYVEDAPGTATSDRTCKSGDWTPQFGTSGEDRATSVSVDGSGNVYVAGYTEGTLPGQTSAGGVDAFVRKYDSAGNLVWTSQFGTSAKDVANSVAVDGSGNVYVVGDTLGTFNGQTGTSPGISDAFVRKYDSAGNVLWTQQVGTTNGEAEHGNGVTVDGSGNVYVVGDTTGALSGQANVGANDAWVRKYDSDGSVLWTRQFGTGTGDGAASVSVDGSGNVYVAGTTWGNLAGQGNAGGNDAFVRKYDSAGTALWTRLVGTANTDVGDTVLVDGSGNAYLVGLVSAALPGQTSAGAQDGFVRKYDSAGSVLWTQQFGTSSGDFVQAASMDGSGNVYVAGMTGGTFAGQTSPGENDAFVRKYDGTGAAQWTRQFGSSGDDQATGVSIEGSGNVVVAGWTNGTLPGQTNAGDDDVFVTRLIP